MGVLTGVAEARVVDVAEMEDRREGPTEARGRVGLVMLARETSGFLVEVVLDASVERRSLAEDAAVDVAGLPAANREVADETELRRPEVLLFSAVRVEVALSLPDASAACFSASDVVVLGLTTGLRAAVVVPAVGRAGGFVRPAVVDRDVDDVSGVDLEVVVVVGLEVLLSPETGFLGAEATEPGFFSGGTFSDLVPMEDFLTEEGLVDMMRFAVDNGDADGVVGCFSVSTN